MPGISVFFKPVISVRVGGYVSGDRVFDMFVSLHHIVKVVVILEVLWQTS